MVAHRPGESVMLDTTPLDNATARTPGCAGGDRALRQKRRSTTLRRLSNSRPVIPTNGPAWELRYGLVVNVVNVIEKFGADSTLERSWRLPPDVVEPLRQHVTVTPEGWVLDMWRVTPEIAAIVQPWVDEPINASSGAWLISSEQSA